MKIPIYQADAFSKDVFHGNPAAVCPLKEWLPDDTMQKIAMENNLAETAFIVPEGDDFHIRWFTPAIEVDLCGHATLATAYVYYNVLGYARPSIRFMSKSGWLTVSRSPDNRLTLDFPKDDPVAVENPPSAIFEGLNIHPVKVWKGKFDYLVELEGEDDVLALKPDFIKIATLTSRGLIATAKGHDADFVSRGFFPQSGINEDPVTGSAHCLLSVYWHNKTGRSTFKAIQLSARRGWLNCELKGDRVLMTGDAALYLQGEINL